MNLIAYHGRQSEKDAILAQLRAYAAADELANGVYWQRCERCAVARTIHGSSRETYESRFGIPQILACLEDTIFEGLPNALAKKWPIAFVTAIEPGADLSLVGWRFLHWLITDEGVNPGIVHPKVRGAVKRCADVLFPLTVGEEVDVRAAWSAANAANVAAGMAGSAAGSAAAGSAASASDAAGREAGSAPMLSAARSAVWNAALSAGLSTANATKDGAISEAARAAYIPMSAKLIALLSECKAQNGRSK